MQADRMQIAGADLPLLASVMLLLGLGAVMVFSATIAADFQTMQTNYARLLKHLLHIGAGAAALFWISRMDPARLQNAARACMFGGLVLLALVFIPALGVEVNGSLRWLEVLGVRVQPSEFVKICALIYFADYLARKHDALHRFQVGIVNACLVLAALGLLLLLQPDFGAAAVIFAAVACMLFLAGVALRHFVVGVGLTAVVMFAFMHAAPYRVERLLSYRDPWADPFGGGFQLVQSLIAIGRGEWFGVGLGGSIQKLFYLPHAGNDFLIAVIGEELGAVGIFAVIVLFALLLWRAFAIAERARAQGRRFESLLAQGVGLLFAIQAGVHIGVNTGLLPTKGLTLPLMSYGGSSMLSGMLAVGLLFAIDRQTRNGRRRCVA